ncbi:MAG: hypothetical protein ACSHX0_10325 [Akkermansiaceae bacterium]
MSLAKPALLPSILRSVQPLCRGDHALLEGWLERDIKNSLVFCFPIIILGCSSYGFAMGFWHGWEMASYTAIKLPLVVFATLIINGLINGMLAMVLGSGIGFRHSIQFLLSGFALMSLILLSLSPVFLYIVLHAAPPDSPQAAQWHSTSLLIHIAVIAYAGIISHRSLLGHVQKFATTAKHGTHTFLAWLLGNLFVGAQISWVMRPFFGTPGADIQFLRPDPMSGSFYESLWRALNHILHL